MKTTAIVSIFAVVLVVAPGVHAWAAREVGFDTAGSMGPRPDHVGIAPRVPQPVAVMQREVAGRVLAVLPDSLVLEGDRKIARGPAIEDMVLLLRGGPRDLDGVLKDIRSGKRYISFEAGGIYLVRTRFLSPVGAGDKQVLISAERLRASGRFDLAPRSPRFDAGYFWAHFPRPDRKDEIYPASMVAALEILRHEARAQAQASKNRGTDDVGLPTCAEVHRVPQRICLER